MDARADDGIQEQGKTLKRRGILAAAGAVVAGMVAKQTSQPVAAATGGTQGTALILGANSPDGTANTSTETTQIFHNGATVSSYYIEDAFVVAAPSGGTGVQGKTSGGGHGVYGTVYPDTSAAVGVYGAAAAGTGVSGSAVSGAGVLGQSASGTGVHGISSGTGLSIAVFGEHKANGYGVYGSAAAGGYGVTGVAVDQYGVLGASGTGVAVQGQSGAGFPMIGVAIGGSNSSPGVLGLGTSGPGVQGQSATGHGLIGYTDAADGHAGLVGYGIATGGIGLMGIAPNYGSMPPQPPVGKAGIFYGNVQIIGGALSAPVMQAVVKHAGDNTYRTLHTVASPEGWFEDFGKASFVNGKAEVNLDTDFAALVHTDDYHVFLTEYDDHHSLFVTKLNASGFTVQVKEMGNPTGIKAPTKGVSGTFGYRVVAKRKDIVSERLAKVAAPTMPKTPTAFTIPETPEVKALTKNP